MEPFVVSARKYRPQTFKDVVGQQAITNTLLNAIEHNHLAQALLFTGPRGVGKTTCARILAKKINQDGTEREDEDFAFNIFELDAASNNSVDDIRNLIDQVRIPPQVGKYKVYIIDEVHMLSQSAFNAFLKTLEEPPKHAIFILATTEKHKIIPTILSRCQIFDFKRITVKDAADYLAYIAEQQGVEAEGDALHIIAQKADGAMRDALSIFDRVVSFSGKQLTRKAVSENLNVLDYETYFEATDLILEHNIPQLLVHFNALLAQGFEGHHFIAGLASHFRDLLVCKHQETIALLEVGEEAQKKYAEQSQKTDRDFLLQAIDLANNCDLSYKSSKNQRLLVELTLMKLASLNFGDEKKNPESHALAGKTIDFIIPASFFRNNRPVAPKPEDKVIQQPVNVSMETPKVEEATAVEEVESKVAATEVKAVPQPPTKVNINVPKKRVSALSITSIAAKKEHAKNRQTDEPDPEDLPTEPFTEEAMQQYWKAYIAEVEKKGQHILASNLNSDVPKLRNQHTIWIELPNNTMKKEVQREEYPLMEYLKQNLNNYALQLQITVNEETAKKYVFTAQEKYEKLRERNPAIELLKNEFDLEL